MTLLTPTFLQTKQYSAKEDRNAYALGGPIQAGVYGSGDHQVTQRAAGANMSVDVGGGWAAIPGSSTGNSGMYTVYNDATVNVALAASHATLPRIDQIYLIINDSTHGGASTDGATYEVVTGTPTSGATLDNRSGAGSPSTLNAIRIADILVGANVSSITSSNIRDRRPWLRGVYYVASWSGSDLTTSSTSTSVIQSSLTRRIESSGSDFLVTFNARFNFTGSGGNIMLYVDGAQQTNYVINQAWNSSHITITHLVGMGAGSRLIDWRWNASAGGQTQTISGPYGIQTSVREIIAANAHNGTS